MSDVVVRNRWIIVGLGLGALVLLVPVSLNNWLTLEQRLHRYQNQLAQEKAEAHTHPAPGKAYSEQEKPKNSRAMAPRA